MSGFSPQQLEGMLDVLEARAGKKPLVPLASPAPAPQREPALSPQSGGESIQPTNVAAQSVQVSVSPPPRAVAPTAPDTSDLLGLSPRRQSPLPSGAKNVKCHTIERDPDSGRISKVYTYDLEEADHGDQVQRESQEQSSGSD